MRRKRIGILLPFLALLSSAASAGTTRHEAGRCAIRGHCGKQGFFGGQLPCPDNGLAKEPGAEVREKLVKLCGEKWATGPVCCLAEQVEALGSNLKRAESLISACPACKQNFFNQFCTITCSPDQSLFLNVTRTAPKGDKLLVTEVDTLVSDGYASGFYDSCKDVKVGATNGRAMDLIGGGATNYTQFLTFLGDKKPFGSPFQMNFPDPGSYGEGGMRAMHDEPKQCSDPDPQFRCSCVDCAASCPALPGVQSTGQCLVGVLPCFSFIAIMSYALFLAALVFFILRRRALESSGRRYDRLRLLQDTTNSDDEDEGDATVDEVEVDKPLKKYSFNSEVCNTFTRLGFFFADYPYLTIFATVFMVAIFSYGWTDFAIESDPVRLWVAPNSAAAIEKNYFDATFGPFFRAEQIFLSKDPSSHQDSPLLDYDTLQWWFDVEKRVTKLKAGAADADFDSVCFKPVGDACVVQSVTGYFGGDFANLHRSTWERDLANCVAHPVDCLPPFLQPLKSQLVLSGWNESTHDADSLIATWVVQNHADGSPELETAIQWERELEKFFEEVRSEAQSRGLHLSFMTEMSLEKELNKSTNTDARIIVISYIVMFLYASLALGSTTLTLRATLRNPAVVLVQSKFMLGIVGIIIVLMSVSCSVGIFSAFNVKVTLIIAEVIPFLVLAVGVDNIFLIVHEFERVNHLRPDLRLQNRVAKTLGRVGPSILLSATTETAAFALGAFVGMPAVRNFAIYAAGAVFINAILQVSLFVSVLTLNQKRVEAGRVDCFPCIQISQLRSDNTDGSLAPKIEGVLDYFIRKVYAPCLLGKKTRVGIIAVFLAVFTVALALIPTVELGLDQRIAIPSDSYLIDYFNDLDEYLDVGLPAYFVVKDLDVTKRENQQKICGRFSTCEEFSLMNILEQERKRPEVSYIADPAAGWIDDYFLWLNPSLEDCCVDNGTPCFANRRPAWNVTLSGMPEGREFVTYLKRWMRSPTTGECPLAGQAAYGDAVVIDEAKTSVPASHFRTSHTALKSQADFINAYKSARRIASDISARMGVDVFPYSKLYIFFDQYLSIVPLSATLLSATVGVIFLLNWLFLRSIRTAAVVAATVVLIVVDIIGAMAVAGVSLNAVSLVNLIICVGIAVEFCAHIARAFTFPSPSVLGQAPKHKLSDKACRAWAALANVGGSVFTGITVTKLVGVCVLAFTRSKIFEVYYFRIWLALIIFAATHSLILLPVLLSLFGGGAYADPESEEGLDDNFDHPRYAAMYSSDEESDFED